MMGVMHEHRRSGLGRALKLAQRDRALATGFTLMEWTFDPLQALNAHLNFAKLGVVCDEYVRNLYGDSTSTLHRGTPTDRFVVEWRLTTPHVERRIGRTGTLARAREPRRPTRRRRTRRRKLVPGGRQRRATSRSTPVGFGSRFRWDSPRSSATRQAWPSSGGCTRGDIFETYFGRGYRAVDFELQREESRGRYLLAMQDAEGSAE